jgi:hypothetical protein
VSHINIEKAPRHLWTQLVALLPACIGCSTVLDPTAGEFCAECMERSRFSVEDDLGGES